jgi:hypothetical protein
MTDTQRLVTADLKGGPARFPDELRHPLVSTAQERIKVCHYGGYEHFERDPGGDGTTFQWIGRTQVAE